MDGGWEGMGWCGVVWGGEEVWVGNDLMEKRDWVVMEMGKGMGVGVGVEEVVGEREEERKARDVSEDVMVAVGGGVRVR